jgi:hypothetical protein
MFQDFKDRAWERGYRSTIAFPLRLPVIKATSPNKYSDLVGFLSMDSPQPAAFDPLFRPVEPNAEFGNQGESMKPLAEVELFYGIADSVATILMLCGENGRG